MKEEKMRKRWREEIVGWNFRGDFLRGERLIVATMITE
jgi:hypothetical protein